VKGKKDLLTGTKKPVAPIPVAAKPPAEFTRALAAEIVKNLTSIGRFTARPFIRHKDAKAVTTKEEVLGEYPILVDTSVLIDGRILAIANSGFVSGTFIIPQFILGELQHIADSEDSLRRAKGRRGLDIVNKLKGQKVNKLLYVKVVSSDPVEIKEVDAKLVALAKRWSNQRVRLLTVDFNLAHVARAQGVKILNVNDIAQALKVSLMPGEEFTVKITHEGKERAQGVGYLPDGTMVVVDGARDRVGQDILVIVTKVHQTAAGQLFFARIK
jgi:uncharacterized protein YacL